MSIPAFLRLSLHGGRPLKMACLAASLAAVCAAVLLRATLATFLVHEYLAAHGVRSQVVVDTIDFRGATAHGSLGPANSPDVTFRRLAVNFDPRYWLPRIAEIDIERPTLHMTFGRNGLVVTSLKPWIDAPLVQNASIVALPNLVSTKLVVSVKRAKLFVSTPIGRMEIDGNARFEGNQPVSVEAVVRSTHLNHGIYSIDLTSGALKGTATLSGMRLHALFTGNATVEETATPVHADGVRVAFDIIGLRWSGISGRVDVSAASANVSLDAAAVHHEGIAPGPFSVRAVISQPDANLAQGHFRSSGEVQATARGSLSLDDSKAVLASVPLLSSDVRTTDALVSALGDLTVSVHLSWRTTNDGAAYVLDGPAQVTGAGPVLMRVSILPGGLRVNSSGIVGGIAIILSGRDVPNFALSIPQFSWRGSKMDAVLAVTARFDFGALQDITLEAQAVAQRRIGLFVVDLQRCASMRLASLSARGKLIASDATMTFCAANGRPLLRASNGAWALRGIATDLSAKLDAARLKLTRGGADVAVDGSTGTAPGAVVTVSALLSDPARAARLATEKVTGNIVLADNIVHSQFDIAAGPRRVHIGNISVTHKMTTGTGHAIIDFRAVTFSPQGLQPSNISPLLSTIAQADGSAGFAGRLDWTAKHLDSRGQLDVDDLRFTSPLGEAERLRTHIVFTSLLPLVTAPNQQIDIARVDWALPFTESETHISIASSRIHIDDARTDIAGGTVSLSPLSVDLSSGTTIHGIVRLEHVALGSIIGVSNLGSKLHLEGPVSGIIPFSFGPDGLHFAGGQIEADGPGRLSIDSSLWGGGEANAAEKAAYKAMENLAYDTLSASIDSQPGGRLRLDFHVSGYDDSPGPRNLRFGLFELLRGTAFQTNIPVPQGTAINLELDTSLNFDELLRGYESAWSQMTAKSR
jgi:Dicarboxylate transport